MNDVRLLLEMRAWLQGEDIALPDAEVAGREVAALLPRTRQKRRPWRRHPTFERRSRTLTTYDTSEYRPSPIPASNGHTPTVIGRTRSMLSPMKAITAGALVFALGGAFFIAQPFDRQAGVPGAATNDPAMAPSFFSGTSDDWVSEALPVTERRDDGVVVGTGESYTVSWTANDPRIAGTATMVMNETDYREGATTLVRTGDVGSIRTLLLGIVNDEGSWEGPLTVLQHEGPPEVAYVSGWLTGTGAYEGLSAYLVWSLTEAEDDPSFWGHITAEGAPPSPEWPAE